MQEEGWVVCRAFRKPSPSHVRQCFESDQCYLREQIRHQRALFSSSFSDHHHLLTHPNNNNNSQTTSYGYNTHQQPLIIPEQQLVTIDLPQLDSPKASLGIRSSSNNEEYYSSDVESLDTLFASNLTDSTSASASAAAFFAHSNIPMMMTPHEHELLLQPQTHQANSNTHILGCFHDS